MSQHTSSSAQSEFLSRMSDWEDVFGEGYFTADRPPQYNNTNLPSSLPVPASGTNAVPRTLPDTGLEYAFAQIHNQYAQSWHTNSSATVTADQAAATAASAAVSIPLRRHLGFYINRDYYGDIQQPQQLTESAVEALNNEIAMSSYPAFVTDWISDSPHHTRPADVTSVDVSLRRNPRTESAQHTTSTVGSSWTVVSTSAQLHHHASELEHNVCAAGLQFLDVAAPREGPLIVDEDRE